MTKNQVVSAIVAMAGIAAAAWAHQDDPKLQDRQPPVQAVAFRADHDGAANRSLGFTSDGVSLLSWLPLSTLGNDSSGNDCWGYVSPSGREYAIIGTSNATFYVEVTNPGDAQVVAEIAGPNSLWRDLKVFGHHCYAVSEGGDGIQVHDLSNIDNGVVDHVNTVTTGGTTSTHNVAIDTDSGYLYRLGGGSNGIRIYDLNANPASPNYVGSWSDKYVHDAQFITYPAGTPYAGKQIAFLCAGNNNGWENTGLTILDVSNKSNIQVLSSMEHTNNFYSHQGWLSEDRQYFYLNDELDEQNTGSLTTTRILDVSNLSSPGQVGTCTSGSTSIDHNLYIAGTRMYQANYRSGLRIFDISNPQTPVQVAWFDTYPGSDAASFNGMWSVYPFLPSGTLVCSDLERGLFIFQTAEIEISLIDAVPDLIAPTGASLEVRIRSVGAGVPDPDSFALHVDHADGQEVIPLTPTGDTEIWRADFPQMTCGGFVQWYLTASSTAGQTVTLPSGGGANPYEALVADGLITTFSDDFQTDTGWTVDSDCTDGPWDRGVPANGGRGDPEADADSSGACYVTDNVVGNSDVDGGWTRLTSPILDASAPGAILSYWRWFSNDFGAAPNEDIFVVEVSDDGGSSWVNLETVGPAGPETSGGWFYHQFSLDTIAGITPSANFRVRFTAADEGSGSVVEAGVDGVSIEAMECEDTVDCPADCGDGNGVVDVTDILALLAQYGEGGGCDINGDGIVSVDDMLSLIAAWGSCE